MSSFQINGVDVEPAPPGNGFILQHPKPTGTTGEDKPCGAVGKPWLDIRFEVMSETEWNTWCAYTGSDLSANLTSIRCYDPHKTGGAGWTTFSGAGIIIHRPTYDAISGGNFHGVSVKITNVM